MIIMEVIMSTERINFVRPEVSFADFYTENINDPEIYRWLRSNPQHYTKEQEIEWIKSIQNEPIYTMVSKETNELIGNCGFNSINENRGEIGIWISVSNQNQHYGREAIERLITFGFAEMKMEEIVLTVFENNVRAIRCYKSIGFQTDWIEENVTDGIGTPTNNVHMILKKEK